MGIIMDKFSLFKTEIFRVSIINNIALNRVIYKDAAFCYKLDCGCTDKHEAGYYTFTSFFGYKKIANDHGDEG